MASRFSRGEIRKILGEAHTEDIENQIIALHLGVIDPLKDDLEKYKADAAKLQDVQKELDTLKNGKDYKAEVAKVQKAFDDYKASVEAKETASAKREALRELAKGAGLSEAGIAKAVKYTDISTIELDKDGNITNPDKLTDTIKAEWGDYVATTQTRGAHVNNPPSGNGKMTKDEILSIKDTQARQKAIAENLDLFAK